MQRVHSIHLLSEVENVFYKTVSAMQQWTFLFSDILPYLDKPQNEQKYLNGCLIRTCRRDTRMSVINAQRAQIVSCQRLRLGRRLETDRGQGSYDQIKVGRQGQGSRQASSNKLQAREPQSGG